MQLRIVRNPRWGRSLVLGAVVACATLAATAPSALAFGDGDRDSYTANITPASAAPSTSTQFTVALTNTSSPGSGLSSALITPPLGFRVTGVSLNGAPGSAHVIFNVVVLDHLSVAPQSTLKVLVTATTPSHCNTPFTRWFTWANEGGFWSEDLRLDPSASSLTTAVPCATATGLKFVNQPNDTLVGSTITNSPYDTSGSPVRVELVDSSGNLVNTSGTPVTIALGNNPGGSAKLSGTVTQNTVNGVASFNDLTLDKPNNGYTLAASSGALTNAASNPFNENGSATPCTAGNTCTNTITSGSGSAQIDVGTGSTAATLTESVDVGTPMDGPGSNPDADPGCSSYNPPAASADWYEYVVQPADGKTFDRSKTITWTVNGTTSDGFQVCFGAPYEFDARGTDSGLAPAGTLPDGSQGFVGILQQCSENTAGSPCVQSITTVRDPATGGVSAVATIFVPAGLPGDPMFGR